MLNVYKSVAEAGRIIDKNRHVISHCAKGYRKSAYGYKWHYAEDLEVTSVVGINPHKVFENFSKETGCDVKI